MHRKLRDQIIKDAKALSKEVDSSKSKCKCRKYKGRKDALRLVIKDKKGNHNYRATYKKKGNLYVVTKIE